MQLTGKNYTFLCDDAYEELPKQLHRVFYIPLARDYDYYRYNSTLAKERGKSPLISAPVRESDGFSSGFPEELIELVINISVFGSLLWQRNDWHCDLKAWPQAYRHRKRSMGIHKIKKRLDHFKAQKQHYYQDNQVDMHSLSFLDISSESSFRYAIVLLSNRIGDD